MAGGGYERSVHVEENTNESDGGVLPNTARRETRG